MLGKHGIIVATSKQLFNWLRQTNTRENVRNYMKLITAHNAKMGFNWESDKLYFAPAGGKHWNASKYREWIVNFASWVAQGEFTQLIEYAKYLVSTIASDYTLERN